MTEPSSSSLDSRTTLLGLLGRPVKHSLSPQMHNWILQGEEANFAYMAFSVEDEQIEAALEGMKALGIRGFNVTVPHKQRVLPFLDELSPEARALGAVNTIICCPETKTLRGDNTDPHGFETALHQRGLELQGKEVVVLGAGGSAASVLFALLKNGAKRVSIFNRNLQRAQKLVQQCQQHILPTLTESAEVSESPQKSPGGVPQVEAFALSDKSLPQRIKTAQLLVNTTPVGMYPKVDAIPISPTLLHSDLWVYDLVYNPLETQLLKATKEAGGVCIDGLDMLIHQGMRSLTLWTGVQVSQKRCQDLRGYLLKILSKKNQTETFQPSEHIYLMGYMGAGKTTVGKKLAMTLQLPFCDLDVLIETSTGQSIPDIFAQQGEAGFRKIESEQLLAISQRTQPHIIALGGGTPTFEHNLQIVHQTGTSIYLQHSPEALYEHVKEDTTRPLLAGLQGEERLQLIRDMLQKREHFYQRAELVCQSKGASVLALHDMLLKLLKENTTKRANKPSEVTG